MAGLYSTATIRKWGSQIFEAPTEKVTALQGQAIVITGVTHTLLAEGESTTVNSAATLVVAANNTSCRVGVTGMTGF